MRRFLRWFLGLVLVVVVGGLGQHFIRLQIAKNELAEVIAELDRTDPGWRFEDIEAKRKVIPDAQNAALLVMEVAASLPAKWNQEDLLKRVQDFPPNHRLPARVAKKLEENLRPLKQQIQKARSLSQFQQGRYPVEYSEDIHSTLVPNLLTPRQVLDLIHRDVNHQLEAGRWEEALRSYEAGCSIAHSIGDDPLVIAQIIRVACRSISHELLQRILAQTTLSDGALTRMEAAWTKEAEVSLFEIGIRGERAAMVKTCDCIIEGKTTIGNLGSQKIAQPSLWEEINYYFARSQFVQSKTWLLRHMTKALEASKLPSLERIEEFERLALETQDAETPILGKLLAPAYHKIYEAFIRSQAQIHCAITALALERYRLKHGKWPDTLNLLTPEFLKEVPTDPYDGQPLRYRAMKDGVVVFSLGPNSVYGGNYWDLPLGQREELARIHEFRLWDPTHRRLPPLPLPKDGMDK